jgi:hypothetical protein
VSEAIETPVSADSPPAPPSRRREALIAGACLIAMIALGLAAAGVFAPDSHLSPKPGITSSPPAAQGGLATNLALHHEIRALLRRRGRAIVHHDRARFMSTIDPRSAAFRRVQASMFHNLARVKFASWSYEFSSAETQVPARARHRYRAPTYSPLDFKLQYRIAGFDPRPTDLVQFPTFVERHHRWYLGSLTDFARVGDRSATDLWDYAPVHVVRRPNVLVLGPATKLATMESVATETQAAVPKVTSVWGRHWPRRVVVLVPSTQQEMERVDGVKENLNQIAALTSAEISSAPGHPSPVGDRVTINPANWPEFGSLGASIVLAHELTHVATRADTGSQTPKWLSEGFADYVGFLNTGVPTSVAAEELAGRLHAGHAETRLPSDRAFRGSASLLPDAYESAWLACRYIADRYGQHKLVAFYRQVGTSELATHQAVTNALQSRFDLTPRKFTAKWRSFVTSQLG